MQLKSNILMLNYQIQQFIRTFCPHMHWPMFSARGRHSAVFWETRREACRKRHRIGLAHRGACLGSYTELINTNKSLPLCVENQPHSPCWSSPELVPAPESCGEVLLTWRFIPALPQPQTKYPTSSGIHYLHE